MMDDPVKRLLIVDDNVALVRVIQFAMNQAGYETVTAKNGRAALDLAQKLHFDAVISDQQMPEMTGVELCRRLRDLPGYAECKIVLLTAKGLELELPRLQAELGIEAVFPKPFSPTELVRTIHELLAVAVS
jgi:two-component system, chemotaxis family, chemotaxis protein CheY